jgi:hypothetical protein
MDNRYDGRSKAGNLNAKGWMLSLKLSRFREA